MRNLLNTLLVLSIMALFTSCASNSGHKNKPSGKKNVSQSDKKLTTEEIRKMNNQAMDKVSQNLKKLSIAAQASGADAIKFLASDMYLKASAAQIEGDFQTANILFERLVELVPEDDFVKRKFAVSLIRTGELEKSQAYLEQIFTNSKEKDENVGLILAGVYSSIGQTDKAKKTYNKLLTNNPKNEDACIFLSKTYSMEDKYDDAIKVLKRCERKDSDSGVYSFYIGKIYIDKNHLNTAKKYFKKSLKKQPEFSQSVLALGLVLEEQGKNADAIKVYEAHVKKYPSSTMVLTRLVQTLFVTEQYGKVVGYAESLSDHEPDNLNLKVKLGILYTDNKEYHKAIGIFKDLLKHAPDSDKILYYLGAIYQEVKEFENSIDYFNRIPVNSGLYSDSSIQVAHMLSSLAQMNYIENSKFGKKHKEFGKFIKKKLSEIPKLKVEFNVIAAGYYEAVRLNDKAIGALENIKNEDRFTNNHKYYLASIYEKEKAFSKSTDLILDIVEKDPENAHAWNFLGYSYLERGTEMDKAYEYIQKAAKISPNDGYIRDSLGWYYYKTGEYEKALKELHFAVKNVPDDASIQKHLAIIYSDLKKFDQAKKHVTEALRHTKVESERADLFRVLKSIDSKRLPASQK